LKKFEIIIHRTKKKEEKEFAAACAGRDSLMRNDRKFEPNQIFLKTKRGQKDKS